MNIFYYNTQELNEGAHWRLTLPGSVLQEPNEEDATPSSVKPQCVELLHLKFELLYAPFLPDEGDVKVDLMNEVHKLLPLEPVFSVVATQNLVVEKAASGVHSFFPVSTNFPFIIVEMI